MTEQTARINQSNWSDSHFHQCGTKPSLLSDFRWMNNRQVKIYIWLVIPSLINHVISWLKEGGCYFRHSRMVWSIQVLVLKGRSKWDVQGLMCDDQSCAAFRDLHQSVCLYFQGQISGFLSSSTNPSWLSSNLWSAPGVVPPSMLWEIHHRK